MIVKKETTVKVLIPTRIDIHNKIKEWKVGNKKMSLNEHMTKWLDGLNLEPITVAGELREPKLDILADLASYEGV